MSKYSKIFLVVLFFAYQTAAQQYNFRNYLIKDGLPDSYVSEIVQDSLGYIYVATIGGLSRFNGLTFENFNIGDGLPANDVYSLCVSHDNTLWVGTYAGLVSFKNDKFTPQYLSDSLGSNIIHFIIEDSQNVLWVGTQKGLFVKEGDNFKPFFYDTLLSNKAFRDMAEYEKDSYWLASDSGLIQIDNGKSEIFTTDDNLHDNYLYDLFLDDNNDLFIGTKKGVNKLVDGKITNFNTSINNERAVYSILIDEKKNLWLGSLNGLIKYKESGSKIFNTSEGINNDIINCLMTDSEGNLWIGTEQGLTFFYGDNLVRYSKLDGFPKEVWSFYEEKNGDIFISTESEGLKLLTNNKIKNIDLEGIKGGSIYSVCRDKHGDIWSGAQKGLTKFDGITFKKKKNDFNLKMKDVSSIFKDSEENLWICGLDDGVYKITDEKLFHFNEENGLLSNEVYTILEGMKGEFWIGTARGLNKISGNKVEDFSNYNWMKRRTIMDIEQDLEGNLWLGTFEKGLIKFNPYSNIEESYRMITIEDGLNDNAIMFIQKDDLGFLWIGTNKGLNKLNIAQFNKTEDIYLLSFHRYQGFLGVECNQGAVLHDRKGNLWFGTIDGIVRVNNQKDDEHYHPPKVFIKDIELFFEKTDLSLYSKGISENIKLPKNLELPHGKNHITFNFEALSFKDPTQVKFKYKLEGIDNDFSPITNKPEVTYTSLTPGKYKFIVKASNLAGIWNLKDDEYEFTILNPWWNTWQFYLGVILSCSYLVYFIFRLRMNRMKEKNNLLQRRIEERIKYEKKLRESEKDYRGLFKNTHNPIILFDAKKFDILDANQSSSDLLGYSVEELRFLSLIQLIKEPKKLIQNYREVMAGNDVKDLEAVIITKNGTELDLSINATAINYQGVKAILGICRDITEQKKVQSKLLEAKEAAEKSNKLKSEFLAQMSHEIRTPVNTIMNFISFIREDIKDKLNEDSRNSFDIVESGGKRLTRTIDQILNMSDIKAGTIKLDFEIIDIYNKILVPLFNEYKVFTDESDFTFEIENKTSKTFKVLCDEYSITQVFTNLLDNAIKYTRKGSIKIIYSNIDDEYLSVEIIDTGIGISKKYQEVIFNPFRQEDEGYTRSFDGNGLGLALVKHYCELNNADVSLDSEKDLGSAFTVKLKIKTS
ncbi:MAG: PAS domain S-box protein [Melioribacteraceae bacterium]|nr:PAS domain S-box protein [Melioribacteraceae bacterium]